MAVAFDAFSASAGSGTRTWTHTPVGTPRAVIVFAVLSNATDNITTVTYGGTSCTGIAGSPNVVGTGENCAAHAFFLGASIPTGAQSVVVTQTGGSVGMCAYAITLTAATDTEVVDSDGTISSTSIADPSVTLSLASRTSFAALAFSSGHDAVTSITQLTGWTNRNEVDLGATVTACYTYDTIGTTDVTAGWTQTADDAAAMCVAVSEVSGATNFNATGDLDAQAAAISGAGLHGRVSTGALSAQAASIAGAAVVGKAASGALQAGSSAIAGAAIVGRAATGALASQSATIDGSATTSGAANFDATGALAAQAGAISGAAIVNRVATGDLLAQSAAISGAAIVNRAATGALAAQSANLSGTATTTAVPAPEPVSTFKMDWDYERRRRTEELPRFEEDEDAIAAILIAELSHYDNSATYRRQLQ